MTDQIRITDFHPAVPAAQPTANTGRVPLDTDALIATILDKATTTLQPLFAAMDWAEQEITEAICRHPGQADILYHCFAVLTPRDIGPGMGAEFVYRGHARELLERAATGMDLRWATAAEIILSIVETSKRVPLHGAGAGLYFRMWLAAFPDHPITAELAQHQSHYEHLHGPHIDELEQTLRHKISDPDRQLNNIACPGRHHGKPVHCSFAVP